MRRPDEPGKRRRTATFAPCARGIAGIGAPCRALAFAALVSFWIIGGIASAGEIAERPAWAVDDSWTYDRVSYPTPGSRTGTHVEYTLRVTNLTAAPYVLERASAEGDAREIAAYTRWSLDGNFLGTLRAPRTGQEFRWYRWPLAESQTWDFAWTFPQLGETTWTAKVVGWETVTVPAGTFRAARIEIGMSCFYNSVDSGACSARDVLWYSPQVKRHVRLERQAFKEVWQAYDIREELVRYRVR